ncbi:MAG TPA: biotin carboxylase N-terminal domain-containing protein [Marmoricola sp.]|nr:biotin carboxylase N-terminal domain-containing protein [Marmoricola sp.]
MLKRLLIANRGEIALRVARTAEAMGLEVVFICTAADAEAPHAREGAVEVPTYLDIEAVVAAAVAAGADSIHPGYGFLSERPEFARAVEAAGLKLVGPSATVMEQMGRKDAARKIAVAAGVPVVPRGEEAGFPVLVKAAAGGGGKGMRIVRSAAELAEAKAAAAREAAHAFGDDTLLIEKYVEHGRHIEVQIIADSHGRVLHLFERDCSAQRRHQKVLEEAPAPTISAAIREQVTSAAVALATHVGYENAGTVEFLLDTETDQVYFLEMNTRLQVEHPVTELITGLDLVELQLLVAAGQPLPVEQDQITTSGHAIEARIYAEDAFGGFLPQAGRADLVMWPDDVRVDHALESGQVVSTGFDPMLGKVIAWGSDRSEAITRLTEALDNTAIFGLTTNTGFLRALVASPEFAAADIDTAWLDHHRLDRPEDDTALQLLGAAEQLASPTAGAWGLDGWRGGGLRSAFRLYGRDASADCDWVAAIPAQGYTRVEAEGTAPAWVRAHSRSHEVIWQGQRFGFSWPDSAHADVAGRDQGSVRAPMPGTLIAVNVAIGDQVSEGDTLGVLEAMKMELALKATRSGVVTDVAAQPGQQVALGAELFHVGERADD